MCSSFTPKSRLGLTSSAAHRRPPAKKRSLHISRSSIPEDRNPEQRPAMKSRIGSPSLGRTTSLHARRRRSRKARSPAASSSPWLAAVRVNGSSWGSSWPGAFRWDGNNRHNRLAIDPLHGQPPSARPQSRLGQLPVQDQTRATAGTAATRSAGFTPPRCTAAVASSPCTRSCPSPPPDPIGSAPSSGYIRGGAARGQKRSAGAPGRRPSASSRVGHGFPSVVVGRGGRVSCAAVPPLMAAGIQGHGSCAGRRETGT
jgi:hypothetical protein